jgi:benzoyl-CoA reductase/2-hydroxyglutaryl-CoA dehydratase subunit BcrC/BadD/HgdB
MNTTNNELIKFAKDQCEIFPEDSYMGKYLRETIKMLEERTLVQSSNDVMWNSVQLLNRLRTEYCSDDKVEYYKALSLAIQSIRKQMLDKLDVEFFTDLKNELLKKIKQTREEIDTDVRTTVKHFTNTDAVIDYVLDSIDELIEEEEE